MIALNEYDLDLLNKVGFYSVHKPLHAPGEILDWWVDIIVLNTGGTDAYALQILIPHVSGVKPDIYIRISAASKWENWYKVSVSLVA